MRYIVIATRTNGYMRMGWPTKEEQLSCAELYQKQGWRTAIADCPTEMHVRLTDNLYPKE